MLQFITAGIAGLNAYLGASVQSAVADANNRVSAANADAGNRVRGAGNAFEAAKGSLARYIQSIQNNQTLEAGGQALEQNLINARRHEDAMLQGDFEQAIRDAEQTGAQAAAAAFAGVGGEVADTVSAATKLSQQRAAYEASRNRDYRLYDDARRAAVIQTQTIRSLDSSLILDSLDYNVNAAQRQSGTNPLLAGVLGAAGQAWNDRQSWANWLQPQAPATKPASFNFYPSTPQAGI